ncbi:MAG: NUDIX domain-containing protein [Candidatus Diapherotrites archaeon]|uniref:NUDIX domain-containing protein n=1 Tax=Candidatus Iainarchaeum sp. TaxID=3101447 RepID=A0A938YRE1_9ARCH|nr:NUDIX domain-containing protein [Candidatus Diapherotrites archaeon]
MSKEFLPVVDENDSVVGKVLRDECHKKGLLHRSVHIFIFNSKGDLLLQMRSKKMDLYPGFFTSSASGHVSYGETYQEAAEKELAEELGADIKLELFGKYNISSEWDNHFVSLFVGHSDGPFNPDASEVEFVKFCPIPEIKRLMEKEKFSPNFKACFENYIEGNKGALQ